MRTTIWFFIVCVLCYLAKSTDVPRVIELFLYFALTLCIAQDGKEVFR